MGFDFGLLARLAHKSEENGFTETRREQLSKGEADPGPSLAKKVVLLVRL